LPKSSVEFRENIRCPMPFRRTAIKKVNPAHNFSLPQRIHRRIIDRFRAQQDPVRQSHPLVFRETHNFFFQTLKCGSHADMVSAPWTNSSVGFLNCQLPISSPNGTTDDGPGIARLLFDEDIQS